MFKYGMRVLDIKQSFLKAVPFYISKPSIRGNFPEDAQCGFVTLPDVTRGCGLTLVQSSSAVSCK